MKRLSTIKRLFFYGGLTRDQYSVVSSDVTRENLKGLRIYAPIGCIVFLVLWWLSLVTNGVASHNTGIYISFFATMAAISVASYRATVHSDRAVRVLEYLFMFVLYAFSISVSMAHAEYPAVSAIVFLTVTPLLFVCRPIGVTAVTCCATTAICIASFASKEPMVAADDTWNAVSFGIVGLAANMFVMRMKHLSLYQAYEIAYLSETDVLTGLKNRNCYESRLEDYPRSTDGTLVCVYVDADGLHELNNERGHDAGDMLLKSIANAMLELFGEDHTYRIGGDEFVAFVPWGSLEEVRDSLKQMRKRLLAEGYVVSYGAAAVDSAFADMRTLVRNAEKEMYSQKFESGAGKPRVSEGAIC